MRKFTKITLILSGIMFCLGVGCLLAAFAMGLTSKRFAEMVDEGQFSFQLGDYETGLGSKNKGSVTIAESCKNLDIEIDAGNLEIYYEDIDEITVEQKGMPGYEVFVKDRTLYIESASGFHAASDASLTLVLPIDMYFKEVDLELGASKAEISNLSADTISVEVGAGDAQMKNLKTFELDAEVGIGKLELELWGRQEDYNYSVECGIGSVKIGDTSYSGMGTSKENGNMEALQYIDIECGIGEIEINFIK